MAKKLTPGQRAVLKIFAPFQKQLDTISKAATPPPKSKPPPRSHAYDVPVPRSIAEGIAKKAAIAKLHEGGGFIHGVTSFPGEVAHGAKVVEHTVVKAAPKVARTVVTPVTRAGATWIEGLNPNPHAPPQGPTPTQLVKRVDRRAVAGGESAGAAGDVVETGAAKVAARLAIGGAVEANKTVNEIKALAAGHPIGEAPSSSTPPSTLGQLAASRIQEQGILPSNVVKEAIPATAKVLVGGAGAAYAFRHPSKAVPAVVGGLVKSLVGTGIWTGAMAAEATDPKLSFAQRKSFVAQPIHAVLQSLADTYGPNASYEQVFKRAQKDPFTYGSTPLAILDPAAKVLSMFFSVGRGATLGEALEATRIPATERTLNINVEGGAPKSVTIPQSQSPLYRGTISKPGDLISKAIDGVPGLRRLPIAESSRAARALRRQLAREEHRMPAQAQAIFRQIHGFLSKRGNDHYATALAQLMQKPEGFTDDEWMHASMTEIRNMLEHPDRFVTPEERATPGVQRLLNRVKRYESREEDARTKRRARANVNIVDEQERLSVSLSDISGRRQTLQRERANLVKDETLSPADRDQLIKHTDARLRALKTQADTARQELDDLSVDNPPIEHPARTQLIEQAHAAGVDPEEIADDVAALDAHANSLAGRTGGDPGDFYDGLETRVVDDHAEIPGTAMLQREALRPDELAAERARFDNFDPESIKSTLDEESAGIRLNEKGERIDRGTGLAPSIKSRADLADLSKDLVRRLQEGYPYAKDWYSESGKAILDYSAGDKDTAQRIAALFAIYSPQKPVPPNLALAFRAYEDHRLGREPTAGSARQQELAKAVLNEKDPSKWFDLVKPRDQPKVRRFYANILKHVDEERMKAHGFSGREVTADGWMGAAFGHGENTASASLAIPQIEHIERMTQALADHYGLEPEQAQAAIWTSIKAERDKSTRARYLDPATRDEALNLSGESFAQSLFRSNYTLRVPFEAMTEAPGMEWLKALTPEQQVAYTRAAGEAWVQSLREEGFFARQTDNGFGFYVNDDGELEVNPASAVEIAIGDQSSTAYFGQHENDVRIAARVKAGELTPEQALLESRGKPVFQKTATLAYKVRPDQRAFWDGLTATIGKGLDQQAQTWARRFSNDAAGDATGWRINVGRGLTRDEMIYAARELQKFDPHGEKWHLTQHNDGFAMALNDPDSVLDRAIRIGRHKRAKRDYELESLRAHHNKVLAQNEAEVERVAQAGFADSTGTLEGLDTTRYSHRGSYLGESEFEVSQLNSGRPDLLQRLGDRYAVRRQGVDAAFREDPEGATSRVREGLGRDDGTADRELAPVRQQDVRGAVQWLDTAAGHRILYLVRGKADGSTILHELVGHAVDELRQHYPQEFAEVERFRGKPLADWDTADHEWLATSLERYVASGQAPTPELVGVFQRAKTWMRSIYGTIRSALGPDVPVPVRVLFDSYFGAYDDENVARVAMNMGREGWGREDLQRERFGGAKAITQQELRTVKKSIETRRYNRSLDGMVTKLDESTKRLDDLYKKGETWTPEEQDEFTKLSADVLVQRAEVVVRADKREQALSRKLTDLEKSLEKGTDSRGFQGALMAMKWLAENREEILRDTFGAKYDEVFAGRRDLMADWLVNRGLLQSDYSRGTGHYFPMEVESSSLRTGVSGPAASLTSRVVGKTKMDLLKLHKRNQMILWQNGDWSADPRVLLQAHSRAQGYAWMNKVKQNLYDVGRPLTHEEAQNLPTDVYLINLEGTPLGPGLRNQLSGSSVEDAHRAHDGLEGLDNDALEQSMKNYWDAFAIDPNQLPPGFNPTQLPGLRVVPKSVVHTLLRPLKGGETAAGTAWDWTTTAARLGLIYANVPGYMITNAVGNLGYLLAQQGWKFPGILRDSKSLLKNPQLLDLIGGETGDLPAIAAVERGRGFSGSYEHAERKLLTFESVVDKYPRALAWKYEARKRGYRTDEQQYHLLSTKNPTAKEARDRNFISDTATNHMIDFNRLSPFERQTLTRALFIYPYVRGATAWPFWYAKQYPGRAAVLAQFGTAEYNRQQKILGPTPPWYSDLYPVSRHGDQAQVINTGPASPTSMAVSSLRLISDTVASLLGREPDTQTSNLIDSFMPAIRDATSIATQKSDFGQDQSIRKTLETDGLQLVPGLRLIKALQGSGQTPRVFQKYDRSRKDQIERTFLRIGPETVTVPWLNAEAQVLGAKTTSEKIDAAVTTAKKQWHEVNPKETYNQYVDRATRMKVVYDDRMAAFARSKAKSPDFVPSQQADGSWDLKYDPSEYERAVVAHAVIKQYYPKASIPSPNKVLADAHVDPSSAVAQQWMKKYMSLTWDRFTKPANTIKSQASKESTYKKIQAEAKRKKAA